MNKQTIYAVMSARPEEEGIIAIGGLPLVVRDIEILQKFTSSTQTMDMLNACKPWEIHKLETVEILEKSE